MNNSTVNFSFLNNTEQIPLVISPKTNNCELSDWAFDNKNCVSDLLDKHGALLFRGFHILNAENLEKITSYLLGDLINNIDRGTQRSGIKGKIFTASDASGEINIPMHCESSFAHSFPGKIFFYCNTPPLKQGETPIANVANVFKNLSPEITKLFSRKGITYVRNLQDNHWEYVFQVSGRDELETYCKFAKIKIDWIDSNSIRASQKRPAALYHPVTKEPIWFNQVDNFYYRKNLGERINPFYSDSNIYRASYFGDGSEIPHKIIKAIKDAYEKEIILFPWQQSDLLILDNMRVAHGRKPFSGNREIWTGMSSKIDWNEVQPILTDTN
jgi:alpha-ketoglutarate-dependent taurine dioxygenase